MVWHSKKMAIFAILVQRQYGVEVTVSGDDPEAVANAYDKLAARYGTTPGYRVKQQKAKSETKVSEIEQQIAAAREARRVRREREA